MNVTMRTRVVLAFTIIYLVWGSTFLATRLGVRDLPPLLFAGMRTLLAGLLLLGIGLVQRDRFPRTIGEWRTMLVLALLMMALSSGPSTIGLKHLPSNEVALLNASNALWIAGLGALGPQGHKLRLPSVIGLVVGFVGVGLLVWPRAGTPSGHIGWQLTVLGGCLSWSIGTILFRNSPMPVGPLATNAVIMILGAIAMIAGAAVHGEFPAWHWDARGVIALVYLAVFGSALAYTAYAWLLRNAPTDRVATFAYVNPAIATILGWAVLGENLGPLQIAGTLVILFGVALVTMPSRVR
jgi:drug/metabolite transporter (DMT)-like permease